MFNGLIDISVTKDLTQELVDSLKELANQEVCIGIPQEDNTVHSTDKDSHESITNAELLYIHTNGIRDKKMIKSMQHDIKSGKPYSKAYEMYVHENGSPLWHSPPRPVLAPAIENHQDEMAEQMSQVFQDVLDGNSVSSKLGTVGMLGQNICRAWFTDPANKWAPNSPETIKRKGSSNPLIDQGSLRAAITYVIRDRRDVK